MYIKQTSNIEQKVYKYLASALLAIIICEGFVSVSVEILAMRQLIPFVGNSVIVTSLIIGIFLLFLAVGYWKGGQYKDNFYTVLCRNFIYGIIFIGIGLSYIFVNYFFMTIYKVLPHILPVLTLYLLLIIAPLIYFLGQTLPLTMNLVKQESCIGATGGKVLFWSTVGSFFGSVLTTVLLMQYFGVAWTVFIACSILFLLVCLLNFIFTAQFRKKHDLCVSKNQYNPIKIILFLCLLGFIYVANIGIEKKLFIKTNSYSNYDIMNNIDYYQDHDTSGKILRINNSYSSYLNSHKYGFSYIEFIKNILFKELGITNKEILVIGAGGFSLSAESDFDNTFTYLDIDPEIIKVVKQNFLNEIKGGFIAQDARIFFNYNKKLYDVIVSDAYSNTSTLPANLVTVEYFTKIKQSLKPNGIVVFNIIADPLSSDHFSKRLKNTITHVFKNCSIMPLSYYKDSLSNVIYICQISKYEDDEGIYTDNKNTANTDNFTLQEKALK